jgi:hypothetical protein
LRKTLRTVAISRQEYNRPARGRKPRDGRFDYFSLHLKIIAEDEMFFPSFHIEGEGRYFHSGDDSWALLNPLIYTAVPSAQAKSRRFWPVPSLAGHLFLRAEIIPSPHQALSLNPA